MGRYSRHSYSGGRKRDLRLSLGWANELGRVKEVMKLEIDVPEGATKIDLAPVLIPLLRGLLNRGDRSGRVSLEQVEAFAKRALLDHNNTERMMRLRQQWIINYIKPRGWKPGYGDGSVCFEKDKPVPKPIPENWHLWARYDKVWSLHLPNDDYRYDRVSALHRALRDLAQDEKRRIADILTDIEAMAPVLDRLALVKDELH